MLWEDEDDRAESDRSDDSVYSDEMEREYMEEEERGETDLSAFRFPGTGVLAIARVGLEGEIDEASPTEAENEGSHEAKNITFVGAIESADIVDAVDDTAGKTVWWLMGQQI